MFVVCLILNNIIKDNLISVALQVIVGSITYGTCLLLLKDKFLLETMDRFKIRNGNRGVEK